MKSNSNNKNDDLVSVSFRLPKSRIEFIDFHVDGVYVKDRTHALLLLLEKEYRQWAATSGDTDYETYISTFFKSLFRDEIKSTEVRRMGK